MPVPSLADGQNITVSPVTTPALVVVGFLMMTAARFVPWDRADEAIPAFLTILTLALTFNISYGIGFGFISYVLIELVRGRPGEVRPLLYVVAVLRPGLPGPRRGGDRSRPTPLGGVYNA